MASRSSDYFTLNNQIGTKRGRFAGNDMDWGMFPEKIEVSNIIEDPFQVEREQREAIMDYTPEPPRYEFEQPIRDKHSREFLNLRDGGARTLTDPWRDPEYDIQFHDKDNRGWSTEQPWDDYNRQLRARFEQIDFKDDGDYSVPSQGIHPNSMYKQIRSSQDWLKSRLKIFSTSLENFQNGGVGVYPQVSKVFSANIEDTTVNEDVMDWNGEQVRPYKTFNISNYLHMGSKAFRVNTTTDHNVKVASYNKLYRNKGLLPHESQLRIVTDDTLFMKSKETMHKNMVKLMSSATEDESSQSFATKVKHIFARNEEDEKFQGMKNKEMTNDKNGKSMKLTKDLMALLGFTVAEVKQIERAAQSNRKKAEKMLANLHQMVETVHKLPANVKLQLKDDLLKRKGSILHGDLITSRTKVEYDNKIFRQLEMMTTSQAKLSDPQSKKEYTRMDHKLKRELEQGKLYKTVAKHGDKENKLYKSNVETKDGTRTTVSYKTLTPVEGFNNYNSDATQKFKESEKNQTKKNADLLVGYNDGLKAALDNEFGENLVLERKKGGIGHKYLRRNMQSEDYQTSMNELTS